MKEQNILQQMQELYQSNDEAITRQIDCGLQITLMSLETMCDDKKISAFVLQPLVYLQEATSVQQVRLKISTGAIVKDITNVYTAVDLFTNGYTLVFGADGSFAVDTRTTLGRAIIEPPTSMVMKGPREGFVEDLKVNITLLRKRLKTEHFKIVNATVGKYTNTSISVCYLQTIADQRIVDNIVQRLQNINIDGVLDSSYISKYLDPSRTVLFRRVGMTEKPDIAVAKMLEGRVCVVVDGSPMVLTLPYLYVEDLQSPSDYYENASITTLNRALRFISVVLSVLLPALYVCLQMYNYQIIPLKFLITILNATEAIPFSPMVEMMIVLIIFDILREANLRMPSAVGISLSLVGAIVLGDAAVKAGLIGAPAVMIGALSGIGLFTMPNNTFILSLLRIVITLIGGIMGILGVILSVVAILIYMVSLQNYQAPFLAPYAPNIPADKQDAVGQRPLTEQVERPRSIPNVNKRRRG
ncbi:MAG: spore germination protein [Clostridia bacterium]|nr:spore germination protein [Clostridia bacterium]